MIDVLDYLAGDPGGAGLFLDFDGTLTGITDDPTTTTLDPEVASTLRGLAGGLALLAVVSGRPASFLARQVGVQGVRLLGLYGLEEWRWDGAVARARPEAAEWAPAVRTAHTRLVTALRERTDLRVEDKGLSVAVHWRGAQDEARAARDVALLVDSVAADTGLARESGKLVEELRPPVGWDKGEVVRRLAAEESLNRVVYVGDDLGDLAAFAAVHELNGLAVGVAHGVETPEGLHHAADVMLDGPDAVAEFLARLHTTIAS